MDERVCILDDDGITDVDWHYIRSHTDWYIYIGHCRINGILYHTYRLRQ